MKLISTNSGRNYEPIGEVEVSTTEDVREAIARARAAQPSWAKLSISERIAHIQSFIDQTEKRKDDLSKIMSLETGRSIATSHSNINSGLKHLASYSQIAEKALAPSIVYEDDQKSHTVHREPWGVLACISPWNFPFLNIAWQCGEALLAGNTIVYKNSEENPLFAKMIEEVTNASNLPDGVFNIVYGAGEVGDQLAHGDVDMILFTGSTRTGQALMKVAAEKFIPIHLELGGSSPGIVFDDADIDSVIQTIFDARFDNSGQYCDGLKRLMVHESRFDEVVAKLKAIAESTVVGDPFDKTTQLGPLVAKRQLELLEGQVADAVSKGATIVTGGKRPEKLEGAYYLPTLLTNVSKEMRVWKEEVFGTVLPILPFSTEAEAIELANDTDYGLGAYVYTTDIERYRRVARQLQAGLIVCNNTSGFSPLTPFGGYKKSGIGRQNGFIGFAEVTQIKVIVDEK